jgi:Domain of unknown function (DUF5615)
MLPLAADENFNNDIVRGVKRRSPMSDIVRIQDEGLRSADDPTILEWAASCGRVLLTHDVSTMTRHAHDRVRAGVAMPGVFEIGRHVPIGVAIDQIVLIAECSLPGDWDGQIRYLPL